ncbi:MAG: hypothetical protein, partial [Olavius algarvensis Gamma 1 endosymbiont]
DHRNQPGLAGQVPSAGFGADFRRRSACPVRLFLVFLLMERV